MGFIKKTDLKKSLIVFSFVTILFLSSFGSFAENNSNLNWSSQISDKHGSMRTDPISKVQHYLYENAIACNRGIFVIVGDYGLIETSTDGVVWTEQNSGTDMQLDSIIWDGNQFIAFGGFLESNRENTILTSKDGKEWKKQIPIGLPPEVWVFKAVLSGNRVIIASSRGIFASDDLINWSLVVPPKETVMDNRVINVNGYDNVATNGEIYVTLSDNGTKLSVYDQKSDTLNESLFDNFYDESDENIISIRSVEKDVNPFILRGAEFYNVEWNGEKFIAFGIKNEETANPSGGMTYIISHYYIAESIDGYIWNIYKADNSKALCFGNAGNLKIKPELFWVKQQSGRILNYSDIAWNGNSFVVLFGIRVAYVRTGSCVIYSTPPTIKIYLDGKKLDLPVKPILERDGIYVPMRDMFKAMGFKITWDAKKSTMIASKGKIHINVKAPDSKIALVNGKIIELGTNSDTQSKIINDNVMIPVSFISKGMGFKLNYDEKSYTVRIER